MGVVDLLQKYQVEHTFNSKGKVRNGWVGVRCPQCQRWPYLGIRLNRPYGNCWMCGRLPLYQTLMDLTGAPYQEIRNALGVGQEGSWLAPGPTITKKEVKYPPGLRSTLLGPHRQYLEGRGFDPDLLEKVWGLRGIDETGGRMAWRVFIPVCDEGGREVSWTTRRITDTEPRYVSARDSESVIPIEHCLYGVQHVRGGLVLVEGPTDAWRVGPGAVALLGLRTSPTQLRLLAGVPVRAIAFDNEPQARLRARQLLRDLAPLAGRTACVTLESASDPGGASPEEISLLRKEFIE